MKMWLRRRLLRCWSWPLWLMVWVWAGVGVVRQPPIIYISSPWSDRLDPKVPLPPVNPPLVQPQVQDDTSLDIWTPERLHRLLNQPQTTCRRLVSLGGGYLCADCHTCLKDGNKFVCFDPDVRPRPRSCVVYSVGVGGEITFDGAMRKYSCNVFAFDMTMMNFTNSQIHENFHFLDLGLEDFNSDDTINMTAAGGDKKEWESREAHFRTLETIRDILDHRDRPIDILKLDIENFEWRVLEGLIERGALAGVRQLALEIHLDGLANSSVAERVVEAQRAESVLEGLSHAGFRLAHVELNTMEQVYTEVRGQVFPLYREALFLYRPHHRPPR